MKIIFQKFQIDEAGSVTVDMVVLMTAIVGMAAIVAWPVRDSVVPLGQKIADFVAGIDVLD